MSLHRRRWMLRLIHHKSFVSAAATASVGPVLAIGDGIVPINDSMASIRGPRIRKRASGAEPAARLWAGRTLDLRTIRGQTFRSQSARRARPHESTQTRRGV